MLLIVLSALLLSVSCQKSPTPVSTEYTTWTNPITQAQVHLPKGWRHSPTTAQKGTTSIGFFAPQFAAVNGKYGHVTLHYEDMRPKVEKRTLRFFVDNFISHLNDQAFYLSEPSFTQNERFQMASVTAQGRHNGKDVQLKAQFWTANELDFWYAITESLAEDTTLEEKAEVVIGRLVASTGDLGAG